MPTPPKAELVPGSDQDPLARLVSTADRAAFEQFYELYFPRVYAFATRRVSDPRDVEPLTKAIFEESLRGLERAPAEEALEHRVLRVALRVAASWESSEVRERSDAAAAEVNPRRPDGSAILPKLRRWATRIRAPYRSKAARS